MVGTTDGRRAFRWILAHFARIGTMPCFRGTNFEAGIRPLVDNEYIHRGTQSSIMFTRCYPADHYPARLRESAF